MEGAAERTSVSMDLWWWKSRTYELGAQSKADGMAAAGIPTALFADRCSSNACGLCNSCRNEVWSRSLTENQALWHAEELRVNIVSGYPMGITSHPRIAHRLLQELQRMIPPAQPETVILAESAIISRSSAQGW